VTEEELADGALGGERSQDEPFGDRLARSVAERSSQLVVGLDPDPAALWPRAYELANMGEGDPALRAAFAVAIHCALVIEAVAEQAVAVKLQVACFERLGAPGWATLAETTRRARERGLLVIADAKRGDIDVTAAAYGQAYFGSTPTPYGEVSGISADALTVNPLLGGDALEPLAVAAREVGGGLFVLVRTSNAGAADLQDRSLRGGETVSERVAELVQALGAAAIGSSGLSDVGAVVGATAPERLARLRELMPEAVFLLPGVGAQGGRVEALSPALGRDPASILISSSRGIVSAEGVANPADAARAEAARLRELAWGLRR
jgi:orotidine-5'-phosphate decarboxylase